MKQFLQRCLQSQWFFTTKVSLCYKSHRYYTSIFSSLICLATLLVCLVLSTYHYSSVQTIYVTEMMSQKETECAYCHLRIDFVRQIKCNSLNFTEGMCFQILPDNNINIVSCQESTCNQLQLHFQLPQETKQHFTIRYEAVRPSSRSDFVQIRSVNLSIGRGIHDLVVDIQPISITERDTFRYTNQSAILESLAISEFSTNFVESTTNSSVLLLTTNVSNTGKQYQLQTTDFMEVLLCFLGMSFMSLSVLNWIVLQRFNQNMFIIDCARQNEYFSIQNVTLFVFCLTYGKISASFWAAKNQTLMECYNKGTKILELQTFLEQLARLSWQERPQRRNRRCRAGPSFEQLNEQDKQMVQALAAEDMTKSKIFNLYDPSMFMEASSNTYR